VLRRNLAPVTAALTGAALVVCGLLGVGGANAAGSASHYVLTRDFDAYSGTTKVVRWAPCITRNGVTRTHVIDYKVNTAGVASRVTLVKHAVGILARATGLTFHYAGRTRYIPHYNSLGVFQAGQQKKVTGVPLVVAWARQGFLSGASNMLVDTEAGVGTISWKSSGSSQLRIVAGAVVIKRGPLGLRRGFGAGGTVGTLLLHELGHAVGMKHTTDTSQVMYPIIGASSPGTYAAGDRTGLTKEGRKAGCMRTPGLPPTNTL